MSKENTRRLVREKIINNNRFIWKKIEITIE